MYEWLAFYIPLRERHEMRIIEEQLRRFEADPCVVRFGRSLSLSVSNSICIYNVAQQKRDGARRKTNLSHQGAVRSAAGVRQIDSDRCIGAG